MGASASDCAMREKFRVPLGEVDMGLDRGESKRDVETRHRVESKGWEYNGGKRQTRCE